MKRIFLLFLAFPSVTIAALTTVHELGASAQLSSPSTTSDHVEPFGTVNTTLVPPGTGSHTISAIPGNIFGVGFTYDVVLTAITTNGLRVRGNDLLVETNGGTGESDFDNGEQFSVEITNISDPIVNLDGFVNFSTGATTPGEGMILDGTSFIRGTAVNGDSDPRRGVVIDALGANTPILGGVAGGTALFESIGTTRLRGLAYQFSIPEPSRFLLLVFAGALTLLRRRR